MSGGAGGGGAAGWGGFVEGNSKGIATGIGYGIGGWAGVAVSGGCKVYPFHRGGFLDCKRNKKCNE